jgi:uncharacterized oligopeptide transporter (OPT) family protein
LGVGAMLVGGMYALVSLRKALWKGIEAGIKVGMGDSNAMHMNFV